jgi:hypothetical protein
MPQPPAREAAAEWQPSAAAAASSPAASLLPEPGFGPLGGPELGPEFGPEAGPDLGPETLRWPEPPDSWIDDPLIRWTPPPAPFEELPRE